MFTGDASRRNAKLAASLTTIVVSHGSPGGSTRWVKDLGRVHAAHRVTAAHHEHFAGAVCDVVIDLLGDDATPEVIAVWREAVTTVSAAMMGRSG